MDNTVRLVRPTRSEIGRAKGTDFVVLGLFYKLSPEDPEEFQARFALTVQQATSIVEDLAAAIADVTVGR